MRRVKWDSYDGKKKYEGWLHQFITAADGDSINCVCGVVECDDGYIKTVEVGATPDFRFVTPYQPEARAKDSPFDSAQDYSLRKMDEALSEMSDV